MAFDRSSSSIHRIEAQLATPNFKDPAAVVGWQPFQQTITAVERALLGPVPEDDIPRDEPPPGPADPLAPKPPPAVDPALYLESGYAQLRSRIEAVLADPAAVARVQQDILDFANRMEEVETLTTKNKRKRLVTAWGLLLQGRYPEMNPEDFWTTSIVSEEAPQFLHYMVLISKGRTDTGRVKSSTVKSWLCILCWNILKYTRDKRTLHATGFTLLTRGGLYVTLNNTYELLVKTHELDRHVAKKIFWGRAEASLLIEEASRNSMRQGRFSHIQTCLAIVIPFYTTARPSSLGPHSIQYLTEGKYPRLGDATFFKVGPGFNFDVQLHLNNFKGFNHAVSLHQEYWFNPVTKAHNVLLDSTVYWVAYYWLLGAFGNITIDEIINSNNTHVLTVLPEYKQRPMFIKARQGGHDWDITDDSIWVPMMSARVSSAVSRLAKNAGLEGGGVYPLRRDAGNDWGLKVSSEFAAIMMGHKDGRKTTYLKHYNRGISNFAMVATRLGENETGLPPAVKAAMEKQQYYSAAIAAIIGRSDQSPDSSKDSDSHRNSHNTRTMAIVLTKQDKDAIRMGSDSKQRMAEQARNDAYTRFFENFSSSIRLRTTNKAAHWVTEYAREIQDPKSCLDKAKAETALKEYKEAHTKMLAVRSKEVKAARQSLSQASRSQRASGSQSNTDTFERRQELVANLEGPSTVLIQALRNARPPTENDSVGWKQYHIRLQAVLRDDEDDPEELDFIKRMDNNILSRVRKTTVSIERQSVHGPQVVATNQIPTLPSLPPPVEEDTDSFVVPGRGTAEMEAGEQDFMSLDCSDLRASFFKFIVQPVLVERERRKLASREDKRCPKCLRYKHLPAEIVNKIWEQNFERHYAVQHTAWMELELEMITSVPSVYRCPSCSKTDTFVSRIRVHCLTECAYAEQRYIPLHEEHIAVKSLYAAAPQDVTQRATQDQLQVDPLLHVDLPLEDSTEPMDVDAHDWESEAISMVQDETHALGDQLITEVVEELIHGLYR